jgi:hypothetical protein
MGPRERGSTPASLVETEQKIHQIAEEVRGNIRRSG